jgi:hypothetical protein
MADTATIPETNSAEAQKRPDSVGASKAVEAAATQRMREDTGFMSRRPNFLTFGEKSASRPNMSVAPSDSEPKMSVVTKSDSAPDLNGQSVSYQIDDKTRGMCVLAGPSDANSVGGRQYAPYINQLNEFLAQHKGNLKNFKGESLARFGSLEAGATVSQDSDGLFKYTSADKNININFKLFERTEADNKALVGKTLQESDRYFKEKRSDFDSLKPGKRKVLEGGAQIWRDADGTTLNYESDGIIASQKGCDVTIKDTKSGESYESKGNTLYNKDGSVRFTWEKTDHGIRQRFTTAEGGQLLVYSDKRDKEKAAEDFAAHPENIEKSTTLRGTDGSITAFSPRAESRFDYKPKDGRATFTTGDRRTIFALGPNSELQGALSEKLVNGRWVESDGEEADQKIQEHARSLGLQIRQDKGRWVLGGNDNHVIFHFSNNTHFDPKENQWKDETTTSTFNNKDGRVTTFHPETGDSTSLGPQEDWESQTPGGSTWRYDPQKGLSGKTQNGTEWDVNPQNGELHVRDKSSGNDIYMGSNGSYRVAEGFSFAPDGTPLYNGEPISSADSTNIYAVNGVCNATFTDLGEAAKYLSSFDPDNLLGLEDLAYRLDFESGFLSDAAAGSKGQLATKYYELAAAANATLSYIRERLGLLRSFVSTAASISSTSVSPDGPLLGYVSDSNATPADFADAQTEKTSSIIPAVFAQQGLRTVQSQQPLFRAPLEYSFAVSPTFVQSPDVGESSSAIANSDEPGVVAAADFNPLTGDPGVPPFLGRQRPSLMPATNRRESDGVLANTPSQLYLPRLEFAEYIAESRSDREISITGNRKETSTGVIAFRQTRRVSGTDRDAAQSL